MWKEATNDRQMEINIVDKETGLGEVLIFQKRLFVKKNIGWSTNREICIE